MVGQNKKDTDSICENAGVNERSFLQESPDGDFAILTFKVTIQSRVGVK